VRRIVGAGLWVLFLLGLWLLVFRPRPAPTPALPAPWGRLAAALAAGDLVALRALAGRPGYAAVVAARALAEDPRVPAAERVRWVRAAVAFEGRPALLWGAELLVRLGAPDLAVSYYRRAIGEPAARAALVRLAREGNAAAIEALFRAGRYRAVLPYLRRPEDRGRALLGLGRYREALSLLADPEDRGRALLALGRSPQAAAAFRQAGDFLGLGRALLAEGRRAAAVAAFLKAGDRGLWEAAGALEKAEPARAVALYLRLAGRPGELGDAAAYRAYQLARRRGDGALVEQAYRALRGGYAALAGKPLGRLSLTPLPPAPRGLRVVRALARAGRWDWARGEARYRAAAARGAEARAWAWVLYRLGDYSAAARYGGLRLRYPTPWRAWVLARAQRAGLDPWLLYAVIRVESAFDPRAVSPTGAQGLLQFTDATWREVAARLGEAPADPRDPRAAIRYGAYYLGALLRRFGDVRLALTAYNGGPGYVARGLRRYRNFEDFWRFQPRDEPRRYLGRVARDWAIYRALASRPRREPGFLAGFPSPP